MQTFLPYPDFEKSAKTLDWRRLGKQRVEAFQILKILLSDKISGGWVNHPATKMWKGHTNALILYMNTMINEWKFRGYKNNMKIFDLKTEKIILPNFIGNENYHASHRSNLLRKDKEYYRQFNWVEEDNLPYIWSV